LLLTRGQGKGARQVGLQASVADAIDGRAINLPIKQLTADV
jgi:hypothetical protein